MNKRLIQPINEITDSVELLYEKPNKGMSIFSWLLIIIFGTAIMWCCIGNIDYYVKARGIVRPNENVSNISSLMTGKLTSVNITEGKNVKKGDLLFKVDTTELEQADKAYQREKSRLESDIENLKKLERSIDAGENLFDKTISSESSYYYQYEKYASDLKSLTEQYSNRDVDTQKIIKDAQLSSSNIREQITKYEAELEELYTLKTSVEMNKDLFEGAVSVYAQRYQYYAAGVEVYNHSIATKKDFAEKSQNSYEAGEISKNDYEAVCADLTAAELDFEKYTKEFMLSIEQNIDSISKSISDLDDSLKATNQDYNSYAQINYDAKLATDNLTLELLTEITLQIKSGQANIAVIDKEIAALSLSMKNAEVTAPIDGTVNMYSDLNESDLVQIGQTIATLVPDANGAFKLITYIAEKDIQDIQAGQLVKLRFSALPYQEYGEFSGTVKSISTDTRNSEEGSYYLAEVSIDNTMGYELVSGMECEVRAVTNQRKIIYWLLEKLNFID